MIKHIQTIRQQQPTNSLSVFDHFAELALKGLIIRLTSSIFLSEVVISRTKYLKKVLETSEKSKKIAHVMKKIIIFDSS